MANTRLPALTEITALADADAIYVVDVSNTTDHASGSSRYITFANLKSRTKSQFDGDCSDGSFAFSGGAHHDGFSDFVADEHIAHGGVTLTAGDGLSGGGTIAASRSFSVDINGTTDLATPATADELLISDADNANAIRKADVASVVNLADHDALTNFVSDEHVDHTAVSVTAGDGLTGGGTIASTMTLAVCAGTGIAVNADDVALSHLGLESLADPNADRIAFWDDSAGAFQWLTAGDNLTITATTIAATDTNTTYSAGDGLDLSGTTFSADLKANGGLVIESTELAIDLAASSITGTLAVGDGGTGLTSISTLLNSNNAIFKTISVSGQDDVVADSATDTLTLAAGSNVTITTTAASDTVTIAATDTNTTYSAGNGIALSTTTFSVAAGNGLAQEASGLALDDPANLNELDESTDATDDKILLWDESASSWKYMTLDNLQDSIDTTGGGGGSDGDGLTTSVINTDGDTSAAVNTWYHWDISGLSADRSFSLPATAAVDDRIGLSIDVGDNNYEVMIKNAIGDTINGTDHSSSEWSKLFITGECVILRCVVANTDWVIEHDGRIPCKAQLKNNATQSVSNGVTTKISVLDNEIYDVGDIADTMFDRMTVRRDGKYRVGSRLCFNSANNTQLSIIYKNGSAAEYGARHLNNFGTFATTTLMDLDDGDYVELYGYHSHGSSRDVYYSGAVLELRTYLEIEEVLP